MKKCAGYEVIEICPQKDGVLSSMYEAWQEARGAEMDGSWLWGAPFRAAFEPIEDEI